MKTSVLITVIASCAIAAACGSPPSSRTAAPALATPIEVEATPVPLNPADATMTQLGRFRYAGGVVLTSPETNLLHELSDFVITESAGRYDRLAAIGDEGVIFEGRLVLDEAGRLVGVTDARIALLTGPDGAPLTQPNSDAEGMARLPNGDRLVSFERVPRIWLYPAAGGPPHAVPSPETEFAFNAGMEALSTDPDAGDDAYVVGAEDSGATWKCRLSGSCVAGPKVAMPPQFALVSMVRLTEGRTAYLIRAYDSARGNRVTLTIVRDDGSEIDRMELESPMTVDNFEGVAAAPAADGSMRFYLLSDDNNNPSQRTILLAFDWEAR